MGVDTMPVYDVVDEFRKACVTSKVIDGDRSMGGRLRYMRPAIDWTRVHVIDFGYMFNIGSDRPEALSAGDVEILRQPVMLHGVHLAYPNMLFIERVGPPTTPVLYASYIYDTDDGLVVQYYARQRGPGVINGWVYVGTCDHVHLLSDDGLGVFTRQVHDWNIFCPPHAMPAADQDSANHFLRMTLVLIGALMRRGDEVQVVPEHRDPRKPSTAFVKRDVPSVSVIHLYKQRLIANLRDEKEAAPVVPRTLAAHDRAGTIVARIRDLTCDHEWFEEFRNEYRWRKRCQRCNSCTFWRLGAKVHGGARGPTLHTVALS